jgi:beta-glucosidase
LDDPNTSSLPDLSTMIRCLSGEDFWHSRGEPAAGLRRLRLSDGPHGLRVQQSSTDHLALGESAPATCFPPAVTLGSTWDVRLLEEIGEALGAEARALGVHVLLGPGLNLKRHPAAGRNFEYYSEDPLLSGKLAAAMVRGIQSHQVAACPKHFVANNQEKCRMRVDTIVDPRTLRELYLRGFEIVVAESNPWAMMASYNLVNGEHTGESRTLLTEILRDEWGFDGLVVSDWLAVWDRPLGVWAGLDLEMPGSKGCWDQSVADALADGSLEHEAVVASFRRLQKLADRVWSEPEDDPAELHVLHEQHHDLARRAAAAGTVLLCNDGILPLPPDQSVGVIGAFAAHPRYQGGGSSRVIPTRLDALLPSLRARLNASNVRVEHARGYDPATGLSTPDQLDEAARIAASCDVALVVVGLPTIIESEGWDRTDLNLPDSMNELVEHVLEANPRTIVVLQHGAPIEMPWCDPGAGKPAALLEAWLGGQAGGSALVDILYGDTEPGGRLAESFPMHVEDLPANLDFSDLPTRVVYREGFHVGYRFHDTFEVEPAFCFGHGLGYTSWQWGELSVEGTGAAHEVSFELTNVGDRFGAQVVQLYVRGLDSVVHRPAQELAAFAKVELAPGESREVAFELDRRAFAHWCPKSESWLVESGEYEIRVGASSRDIRATATITVSSDDEVEPVRQPAGPAMTDAELAERLGYPVPAPRPLLPFHRDSLFADLEETAAGRAFMAVVLLVLGHKLPEAHDEESKRLVETVTREAPVRNLAATLGGRRALDVVDGIVWMLNTLGGRRAGD